MMLVDAESVNELSSRFKAVVQVGGCQGKFRIFTFGQIRTRPSVKHMSKANR